MITIQQLSILALAMLCAQHSSLHTALAQRKERYYSPKEIADCKNYAVYDLIRNGAFINREHTYYAKTKATLTALHAAYVQAGSSLAYRRSILHCIYQYMTPKSWDWPSDTTRITVDPDRAITPKSPFNFNSPDTALCYEETLTIPRGKHAPYWVISNADHAYLLSTILDTTIAEQQYALKACFDPGTNDMLTINTDGTHAHYTIINYVYCKDTSKGKNCCTEDHRVAHGVYQKMPSWQAETYENDADFIAKHIQTLSHISSIDSSPKMIRALQTDRPLKNLLLPLRYILMHQGIRMHIPPAIDQLFDRYIAAARIQKGIPSILLPRIEEGRSKDPKLPDDADKNCISFRERSDVRPYTFKTIPPVLISIREATVHRETLDDQRSVSILSDSTKCMQHYTLCAFISSIRTTASLWEKHLIYFDLFNRDILNATQTPPHRHIDCITLKPWPLNNDEDWCYCNLIKNTMGGLNKQVTFEHGIYVATDILAMISNTVDGDAYVRSLTEQDAISTVPRQQPVTITTPIYTIQNLDQIPSIIESLTTPLQKRTLQQLTLLEKKLAILSKDVELYKKKKMKQLVSIRSLTQELSTAHRENDILQTTIAQLKQQHNEAISQLQTNHQTTLQQLTLRADQERQAIVEKNNQLQRSIDTLQRVQSSHADTIRDLENTISAVTGERDTLQQRITAQTRDISQAKIVLKQLFSTIPENIQSQRLDKIDPQLTLLKQRRETLKQTLTNIQRGHKNKIVTLERQIKTLQDQHTQVQDTKITAQIEGLTRQLAAAHRENDILQTTIAQLKQQHNEAISQLQTNHQTTLQQLMTSETERQTIARDRKQLQESIATLQTAQSNHADTIRKLQNTISEVTGERNILKKSVESQIQGFNNRYTALQNQHNDLQELYNKSHSELRTQNQAILTQKALLNKKNNHILYSSLLSLGLLGSSAYFWRSHSMISMWALLGAGCLQSCMVISSLHQ